MDQVLNDFPEGHLVHKIAVRRDNLILDQEITFAEPGESRDKIDLCYFDTVLGKLVFVEVKRVVDGRLFGAAGRPEVLDQLTAYCRRLTEKRAEILNAFQTVVSLKRSLGLGSRLTGIPDGGPFDLIQRPLLVIGGCSREQRNAIRSKEVVWLPLMSELSTVAAGLVVCGDDGCKLTIANSGHSSSFM